MELVFVENLKPGMIMAEDIFAPENLIIPLVRKNAVLNRSLIDKLAERGVRCVHVNYKPYQPRSSVDSPSKLYVPKPKPTITENLRKEAIGSLEDVFSFASLGKEKIHTSSTQIIKHLDGVVEQLVDTLLHDRSTLVNINDLKSYDEYTFHHSLSVAVLSIAIGQYLGFKKEELNKIGKCAIMHDIGKIAVPIEIIHKTSRLDEQEFSIVKNHSPAGYEYLAKTKIGDEAMWQGVLHHHEKIDGTGYPSGIKGEEIPLWSRIISVADVYDALTSDRPYRVPMHPGEAIEYIMGGIGTAFDYDIVSAFVKKVELYPPGSYIELSNGKYAVVLNNEHTMRPLVRVADTGEVLDLYRDRKYLSVVVMRLMPQMFSVS